MQLSTRILSFTRPFVFPVMLVAYLLNAPDLAHVGLYTVSAAFYLATSAVLVGWIPSSRAWWNGLLWAEIVWAAVLNWVAAPAMPGGPIAAIYAPILTTVLLDMERRVWPLAISLSLGGWLVTNILPSFALNPLWAAINTAVYGTIFLFAGGVGLLIRYLKEAVYRSDALLKEVTESRAALERANRQLRESAARQQEMAVLQERQRLAREIHDGVAHSLTALVVQTQVAERTMARDPDQARTIVAACSDMAREALQETRRAVRALHPSGLEQQHDAEALRRLGRDFSLATGIRVAVECDQSVATLPPDPERLEQLYRIFQEALTNAYRHGGAKQVDALLSRQEGSLLLRIRNDGATPERLDPGIGLKSMEERAQALGGSVRFERCAPGFIVTVEVPVGEEARP